MVLHAFADAPKEPHLVSLPPGPWSIREPLIESGVPAPYILGQDLHWVAPGDFSAAVVHLVREVEES